ncbi:heterokaryon incompatibility protein-domain-containing protein [Corynascus similis CBS 632.67]
MKDLPLTFSDAVRLCRALGIPYLWIDSLCIIQGDNADWARESERMADVYGKATLTFSADGASSSQDGLLQPVTRRRLPPPLKFSCSSSPTADEGELNYVYGRRVFTYDGKNDWSRVHSFSNVPPWIYEPLRFRAWAFQEYLLSLRIVHFATGELLWDCRTIEACECRHQLDFSIRPQLNDPDHECWYGPTMSTSRWWDLVERLSRRYLTYESDMLAALAGVAKVMSAEGPPGDCYIAGHWRSDLPFSLIWRRGGHMRYIRSHSYGDTTAPSHRQAKYIAPSWAWPSVVGPIYHDNDTYMKTYWHDIHKYWQKHVVCKVLSVSYELASSNPYGALQSGSIDIRGLTLMLYGCVDVQDTRRNGRHGRFKVRLKGDEIKVRFIKDEWQPDRAAGPEDVLYLPIVARCHHIELPAKAPIYYAVQTKGLALKAVPEKDDTFVRVGLLRVHFYRRTQRALKELCHGKKPNAKDVLMNEFKLPERTVTII